MAEPVRRRRFDRPSVVAWAVFGTYLVAARVVGNFFPLSVFDMYQGHAPPVVSRVMVRDGAGATAEVDDYEGYVCEEPGLSMALVEQRCRPRHRPLDYVVRDQALHIEAHPGVPTDEGSEPVEIVMRAHVLDPSPDEPAVTDCVVLRCTARRRGGAP